MLSEGSKASNMLFFFGLLFSHVAYVHSVLEYEDWAMPKVEKRTKYCGSDLDQALSIVCQEYNSPYTEKRSSEDNALRAITHYKPGIGLVRFPFFKKSSAVSMLDMERVRRTRGIADECCYRKWGCTYQELSSYCSTPRSLE